MSDSKRIRFLNSVPTWELLGGSRKVSVPSQHSQLILQMVERLLGQSGALRRNNPQAKLQEVFFKNPSLLKEFQNIFPEASSLLSLYTLECEPDAEMFAVHLMAWTQRHFERADLGLALSLYQSWSQQTQPELAKLAQERLALIQNQAGLLATTVYRSEKIFQAFADPLTILSFALGGATYSAARAFILPRWLNSGISSTAAGFLSAGTAAVPEALSFGGFMNLGREIFYGQKGDWSWENFRNLVTAFWVFKWTGAVSNSAAQWAAKAEQGIAVGALEQRFLNLTKTLAPELGTYGGIVLAHGAQEALRWKDVEAGANLWFDSALFFMEMRMGGILSHRFFPSIYALSQHWNRQTQRRLELQNFWDQIRPQFQALSSAGIMAEIPDRDPRSPSMNTMSSLAKYTSSGSSGAKTLDPKEWTGPFEALQALARDIRELLEHPELVTVLETNPELAATKQSFVQDPQIRDTIQSILKNIDTWLAEIQRASRGGNFDLDAEEFLEFYNLVDLFAGAALAPLAPTFRALIDFKGRFQALRFVGPEASAAKVPEIVSEEAQEIESRPEPAPEKVDLALCREAIQRVLSQGEAASEVADYINFNQLRKLATRLQSLGPTSPREALTGDESARFYLLLYLTQAKRLVSQKRPLPAELKTSLSLLWEQGRDSDFTRRFALAEKFSPEALQESPDSGSKAVQEMRKLQDLVASSEAHRQSLRRRLELLGDLEKTTYKSSGEIREDLKKVILEKRPDCFEHWMKGHKNMQRKLESAQTLLKDYRLALEAEIRAKEDYRDFFWGKSEALESEHGERVLAMEEDMGALSHELQKVNAQNEALSSRYVELQKEAQSFPKLKTIVQFQVAYEYFQRGIWDVEIVLQAFINYLSAHGSSMEKYLQKMGHEGQQGRISKDLEMAFPRVFLELEMAYVEKIADDLGYHFERKFPEFIQLYRSFLESPALFIKPTWWQFILQTIEEIPKFFSESDAVFLKFQIQDAVDQIRYQVLTLNEAEANRIRDMVFQQLGISGQVSRAMDPKQIEILARRSTQLSQANYDKLKSHMKKFAELWNSSRITHSVKKKGMVDFADFIQILVNGAGERDLKIDKENLKILLELLHLNFFMDVDEAPERR